MLQGHKGEIRATAGYTRQLLLHQVNSDITTEGLGVHNVVQQGWDGPL